MDDRENHTLSSGTVVPVTVNMEVPPRGGGGQYVCHHEPQPK